jgi:CheY-like chemotaxis protein
MTHAPIKILIADDDEADLLLFKEALKELKIHTKVQTVTDGVQLMEHLARTDLPLPELLFLDLNMPLKSGIECLREIRGDSKFKEVSIAIYSTSSSEKDIEETFVEGANVYINKPNNFDALKKVLEKVVESAHVYQEPPFNLDNFLVRVD